MKYDAERLRVLRTLLGLTLALFGICACHTASDLYTGTASRLRMGYDDGLITGFADNDSSGNWIIVRYRLYAENDRYSPSLLEKVVDFPINRWPGESNDRFYAIPAEGSAAICIVKIENRSQADAFLKGIEDGKFTQVQMQVEQGMGKAEELERSGKIVVYRVPMLNGESNNDMGQTTWKTERFNLITLDWIGGPLQSDSKNYDTLANLIGLPPGRYLLLPASVSRPVGDRLNAAAYGIIKLPFAIVWDVASVVLYPITWLIPAHM